MAEPPGRAAARGGTSGTSGTSGPSGGHRGTPAVQRLVEYAPSTGGLALWMEHLDLRPGPEGAAGPDPAVPLLTDGRALLYLPAFERLTLAEQTGWVAHAVLHVALRHAQRWRALAALQGDVDLELFNTCADAIVNSTLAHLSWLALPTGAVLLEQLLYEALGVEATAEAALLAWDVEQLYRAVDDRRAAAPARARDAAADDDGPSWLPRRAGGGGSRAGAQGQGAAPGRAGGGGGEGGEGSGQRPADAPQAGLQDARGRAPASDRAAAAGAAASAPRADGPRAARTRALGRGLAADLLPRPLAGEAPEDEAEQTRLWGERLQRAHAGDGAFSLLRTLLADLPRSRTPWAQVLRVQVARALAPQPVASWSRPSRSYLAHQARAARSGRRMPFEPGRSAWRRSPRLVVVADVSGSVDERLLGHFATEIEALSRRHGAQLTLVAGDDRVRHVELLRPGSAALRGLRLHGGGGTDFTPLLQEAQAHAPDLVVVLTDLQGPALYRPACPVVWAVPPQQRRARAPFGRVLVIE